MTASLPRRGKATSCLYSDGFSCCCHKRPEWKEKHLRCENCVLLTLLLTIICVNAIDNNADVGGLFKNIVSV